jgi:Flp pilus assembly protein TadD
MKSARLFFAVTLLALLFVCACGSKDTPEPDTSRTATPNTQADAPDIAPEDLPTKPESSYDATKTKLSEDEIKKAKIRSENYLKEHGKDIIADMTTNIGTETMNDIEAGRKALAKKKFDEADTFFQKVLTKKHNDPGVLTELALAAMLKGSLDNAEFYAVRALPRALQPRLRSILFDQLGQIAVKRKKIADAANYFLASLREFNNPDVTKRLDKLEGKIDRIAPLPERIGTHWGPIGPSKDLAALCKLVKGAFPKAYADKLRCDQTSAVEVVAKSGSPKRAVRLPLSYEKTETHEILAIETKAGWFAVAELVLTSSIVNVYTPGDKVEYSQFEFAQIIPGNAEELVVNFKTIVDECEPLVNEYVRWFSQTMMICSFEGARPSCHRIPYYLKHLRTVLSPTLEKRFPASLHTPGLPAKEVDISFELKVELTKTGDAKISKISGTLPAKYKSLEGSTIKL